MEKWIFERGIMTHDRRLKKPFVSHFDTGGFSSLLVRQIPSLKFSPFPLALGIAHTFFRNYKISLINFLDNRSVSENHHRRSRLGFQSI
jgi:hypothetical protein